MKGPSVLAAATAILGIALFGVYVVGKGTNHPTEQPPKQSSATPESGYPHPLAAGGPLSSQTEPAANPQTFPSDRDAIITDVDPSLVTDVDLDEALEIKPYKEYRVVKVNSNFLREKIRNAEFHESFTVELFGEPVTLITEKGTEYTEGWKTGLATWEGRIGDREWSFCTIIIDPNGLVRATFQSEDIGLVTVEALGEGGHHLMWSMDDTKIPNKGGDTSFIEGRGNIS